MSAEPTPLDAHLAERLQASLALVAPSDMPDNVDTGWAVVAAGLTAAFAIYSPERAAQRTFELDHIALLEAIIEWDPKEAMRLQTDPAAWARLSWCVKKAQAALKAADKEIAKAIGGTLARKIVWSYDGVPAFQIKGEHRQEKWDDDALRPKALLALAEKRMPCESCGCPLGVTEMERAWDAIGEIRSFGRWKTGEKARGAMPAEGGLRGLGIEPDDGYREITYGDPTIAFMEKAVPTLESDEITVERRGPLDG